MDQDLKKTLSTIIWFKGQGLRTSPNGFKKGFFSHTVFLSAVSGKYKWHLTVILLLKHCILKIIGAQITGRVVKLVKKKVFQLL
jgi:hypothetical protein